MLLVFGGVVLYYSQMQGNIPHASASFEADTWSNLYGEKPTEAQASTSDVEITIRGEFTIPPPPIWPFPPK